MEGRDDWKRLYGLARMHPFLQRVVELLRLRSSHRARYLKTYTEWPSIEADVEHPEIPAHAVSALAAWRASKGPWKWPAPSITEPLNAHELETEMGLRGGSDLYDFIQAHDDNKLVYV